MHVGLKHHTSGHEDGYGSPGKYIRHARDCNEVRREQQVTMAAGVPPCTREWQQCCETAEMVSTISSRDAIGLLLKVMY